MFRAVCIMCIVCHGSQRLGGMSDAMLWLVFLDRILLVF